MISGIEAAKRNNIVPKRLSEMFKLNYTELTISRPESLIINPTKNYLDGYNEFLAKGKNKNTTVGRILEIIHNWNPRNADIEADYRDRFEIQLKKYFPSNAVKPEQKIGEKQGQGIIDIKVDEVLIEIKSDDALNARYRAVGQINHYSKTHKGPIILLLFDYEKKSAEHYTELMENMWKNGQPIITVIAKEKKSR